MLLAHGAAVDAKATRLEVTPLQDAASRGSIPILNVLLAKNANITAVDKNGFTPLHKAANRARPEAAKVLLAHGASVNSRTNDGRTPLHLAAQASFSSL